jgi:4-amino-4-deoxy-L-arabinose transferase-like glycosyltransferase
MTGVFMQMDHPVQVVLNLVSTAFLAVMVVLILRAPAKQLGRSRWAKAGWLLLALALSGSVNGVYIPVGAAVVLRYLRQQHDEKVGQHP